MVQAYVPGRLESLVYFWSNNHNDNGRDHNDMKDHNYHNACNDHNVKMTKVVGFILVTRILVVKECFLQE